MTSETVRLATTLGLASRLAGRHGSEWLAKALDPRGAQTLGAHALAARASHQRIQAAAQDVCRAATGLGVPVAFMKHGALWLGHAPNVEYRSANDLDVLSRPRDAERLWQRLRDEGYRDCGHGRRPHHLATLEHPRTTFVEVHWKVPGLRLVGRDATFDLLIEQNLAQRIEREGIDVWLPSREFVAAHLLVHGYVQHGASPDAYPCMRMLADLIDLGVARDPDAFIATSRPWISHAISDVEVRAVLQLCNEAHAGYVPPRSENPRTVLDHLVMARLDDEYATALRLSRLTELRGLGGWRKFARRLLSANPAELGVPANTSTPRLVARSNLHRAHMLRMLFAGAIATVRIRRRRLRAQQNRSDL